MEAEIGYDGDDGGSEDGSLSLDEDEHGGEIIWVWMSLTVAM